ncbi:UDP-N-acetylmuramoyl-L-alanyl-D-glutamate--2,6-diaminopimelate ligase [Thalassotalea fusca]
MYKTNALQLKSALELFSIVLPDTVSVTEFGELVNDSRQIEHGDIFCAVIGTQGDGNDFIVSALERNCSLVLAECTELTEHGDITWLSNNAGQAVAKISIFQLNQRLFEFAEVYYQSPQSKLKVIGITGTNGKTSTSQLIARLMDECNHSCGIIGTNGAGFCGDLVPVLNTTPGASELHQLFNQFMVKGASHVAMEISSHALDQARIKASALDIAVFTNLSRDHLDYHGSMASYADAKFQIFTQDSRQLAVINGDDNHAKVWLNNWPSEQPVLVYGFDDSIACYQGFIQAKDVCYTTTGASFTLVTHLGDIHINSPLLGAFNVENLLAAIAVLIAEDIPLTEIARAITQLTPIEGRMESFSLINKPLAVVDYAHTPDALEKALIACRNHCQGQLWVVFGCGGDRDKGKRALMGEVAQRHADHIFITNDNPRTEEPEAIATDIAKGITKQGVYTILLDRENAVKTALNEANAGDVVLLAGKGHEDYIVIGTEKQAYNERELVKNIYTLQVPA